MLRLATAAMRWAALVWALLLLSLCARGPGAAAVALSRSRLPLSVAGTDSHRLLAPARRTPSPWPAHNRCLWAHQWKDSDGTASSASRIGESLTPLQSMVAGALSRTLAQTLLHPAHTYKTLLQLEARSGPPLTLRRLLRGVDAQFLLSLPHGAMYFCAVDATKAALAGALPRHLDFAADFASSALATLACSVVSTPQMVLTDRLMAGVYESMGQAVQTIAATQGVRGFYAGWAPALAQKIPSYAMTWMLLQQLRRLRGRRHGEALPYRENFVLGALAAAGSVAALIPLDTVKTRFVVGDPSGRAFRGVAECALHILRAEGPGALYRALPPRLASVVPMMAIQTAVYEALRASFLRRNLVSRQRADASVR